MSSPFGPPPSGLNLKDNATPGNNAAVIVLTVIATTAVVLRLGARRMQQTALVADDYLILVALFFVYCTAGLSIASGFFGAGKHLWAPMITAKKLLVILKILYSYTFVYAASVSFTKLSIISFYSRIFGSGSRGFNIALYTCTFLTVGYAITVWATMLGSCQPIPYFWNRDLDPTAKGKCINVNVFFLVAGIINMLIDIFILACPIPKIYKLQMSRRRKFTVIGIMLLGSFVCVASIVRIYYLVKLLSDTDLSWIMGPVFIWSSVEPSIGILSACLPVLGPLLRIVFRNYVSSNKQSASHELERTPGYYNLSNSKSGNDLKSFDRRAYIGKLRPDDDEIYLTNNATGGIYETRLGSSGDDESQQPVPDKSIVVKTYISQTSTSQPSLKD